MESMTEHRPHLLKNRHDYLPAAGRDAFLPGYDLLTRVLGMGPAYRELVTQAGLTTGQRVVENRLRYRKSDCPRQESLSHRRYRRHRSRPTGATAGAA